MIFVTVGNARQPFRRLIGGIAQLVATEQFCGEKFVIQRGHSPGTGSSARCDEYEFLEPETYAGFMREADVVVCHGGAGSLRHAFEAGKVPVVMPRRAKFGEHVDDQENLVRELDAQGRIVAVYEPEGLADGIRRARLLSGSTPATQPMEMTRLVAEAIRELIGPPPK